MTEKLRMKRMLICFKNKTKNGDKHNRASSLRRRKPREALKLKGTGTGAGAKTNEEDGSFAQMNQFRFKPG